MQCRFLPIRLVLMAVTVVMLAGCSKAADFYTDSSGAMRWQQLQGRYVVVNYFAEWCAPCLKELPELNAFYRQHAEQVSLFGISFDALDNQQLALLRARYQIEFPLIQLQPEPMLPFVRPKMLPATYIIDPAGTITGPLYGEQNLLSLQQATGLTKEVL